MYKICGMDWFPKLNFVNAEATCISSEPIRGFRKENLKGLNSSKTECYTGFQIDERLTTKLQQFRKSVHFQKGWYAIWTTSGKDGMRWLWGGLVLCVVICAFKEEHCSRVGNGNAVSSWADAGAETRIWNMCNCSPGCMTLSSQCKEGRLWGRKWCKVYCLTLGHGVGTKMGACRDSESNHKQERNHLNRVYTSTQ